MTVVGTLTADPEIKFLPSGAAVVSVNIACNERRYNKDTQQWEDGDTTFMRGTLWRQYAENVAASLHAKDKVIAIGEVKQKSWEKDGVKRTSYELAIEDIGPTLRFVTTASQPAGGASQRTPVAAAAGGWGTTSDEPAW